MSTQSDDFDRAIAHALACTVEIRGSSGTGAGCILHPDGLVITARHVVSMKDGSSCRRAQAVLNPGTNNETILGGTIFFSHRKLDLALLWLDKEGTYPAIPIGDLREAKHAQTVYAIGSPGNLPNTLSKGIISNPRSRFNEIECIQTDAAIDHGNSGGPLINARGQLLGINLWGLGQFDAAKFAVPIDYIQHIIDEAVKAGRKRCIDAYYCPLCGFNDPESNNQFCRNCGVTIETESKQFVSARREETAGDKGEELAERILGVLHAFNTTSIEIVQSWNWDLTYKGKAGFAAVVKTRLGDFILVGSAPVMVLPYKGKMINIDEISRLTSSLDESKMPPSRFFFSGDTINMLLCVGLDMVNDDNATAAIDDATRVFATVSEDLHKAFDNLFMGKTERQENSKSYAEKEYPLSKLPKVRLTPSEMQVVRSVLSNTNAQCQEIYKFLIEKWERAGLTVGTTNQMIVLDCPYGNRRARIAMLFSDNIAGNGPIGLEWGALRKYTGFPKEAVDNYQDAIKNLFALQKITESAAYFEVDEKIKTKDISMLIKEVTKLAASVEEDNIEPITKSGPVTPDNIKTTLETSNENAREVFSLLIEGWNAAGGTVQCTKPGRIYLKMKTKAHGTGFIATLPRNFNLMVLAGPKGKMPEHIKVTQGLATEKSIAAYLDCIPEEVATFEAVTSAMPGFEQRGTEGHIAISKGFAVKHAKELMKQMLSLKLAEEKAP